jgi:outer membrane autotransporter protein
LAVPGRTISSRRSRVDIGLARTLSTNWGIWQPQARLGWRHEFANGARPLAVSFAADTSGTPIVFDTDDADANWGEAGLGAVFVFTGGHSAFIEWRTRFGHAFLDEQMLALGWRVELP